MGSTGGCDSMIEFISRLPQGYQEVEYLENSGTQYIVVDFIPNQDTRLDMLVEPRSVVAAASIIIPTRLSATQMTEENLNLIMMANIN